MILRPYQLQARSNALTELTAAKSTLIECATGLGKTVIFCHLARDWPGRVLILAHRDELIRQAAEKVHAITGQRAAIEMGREKATDELFGSKITVASIQTLARANRRHRFHPDHFSLIVVDEGHHCHVPKTLILTRHGTVPIEEIQVGDMVCSWNGKEFVERPVTNTFNYLHDGPVIDITTTDGMVSVTTNHLMYSSGEKVYARDVKVGDSISVPVVRMGNGERLRHSHALPLETSREETLPEMPCGRGCELSCRTRRGAQSRSHSVSSLCRHARQEICRWTCQHDALGESCLNTGMPSRGHESAVEELDLPEILVGPHEGKESDVKPLGQEEDDGINQPTNRERGHSAVRQSSASWQWWNADASREGNDATLSACVIQPPGRLERQRDAIPLQVRRRLDGAEAVCGNRRQLSCRPDECRPEKGPKARTHWLGDHPYDKPRHSLRESRVLAVQVRHHSGRIYDIEVDGTHNYIANGLLSSNSTAISYREVLQYFGSAKVLFVTATPKRADDVALRSVCETVAFSYGIEPAIDDGWLVPVKQVVIQVDDLDFSRARTVAEDFNAADLDKILTEEKPLHAMVASAHELLGNRQALWFCNTVQHARLTAEVLMRYAPREQVRFLSGDSPREERREAVDAYKRGEIQHLLNCALFLEGFDAPSTSGIIMGRPTKSIGLYTQVLGRGTRPLPGIVDGIETPELRRQAIALSLKPDMLVVDFSGNAGRHKIIQATDVLGGKHEPAEREYAKETLKAEGEPVDIEEALDRAKCELALLAEENERRRHIKADAVNYRVTEISPFTRQYQGKNGKETKYVPPAAERCSNKQAGLICLLSRETGGNWNYDAASRLTKQQAGRIINVMSQIKQRGV